MATSKIEKLPPKIQFGEASTDENGEISITFSPAFSTTPSICCTSVGTAPYTSLAVKVKAASSTAFQAIAIVTNSEGIHSTANNRVFWIAVGK